MSDKVYVFSDEDIKRMKENDDKHDIHFIPKPKQNDVKKEEENQNG